MNVRTFMATSLAMMCLRMMAPDAADAAFAKTGAAIRSGNHAFRQGNYDHALKQYNDGLLGEPSSDMLHYNSGAAYYKKQEYDKAIEAFNKALVTDKPEREAAANYNIGNCKFRQAKLKENTDLEGTLTLAREAISYYQRAIELAPNDTDAKFNHEFVERWIKILLDKLKQQQQQQQKEGQGQQQKQQQQQQQQQKGQGTQQQQKEGQGQQQKQPQQQQGPQKQDKSDQQNTAQKKESQGQQDKSAEQQQAQAAPQQQNDGPPQKKDEKRADTQQQAGQQKPSDTKDTPPSKDETSPQGSGGNEMSAEEAQMLLDNYGSKEQSLTSVKQREQHASESDVERDW